MIYGLKAELIPINIDKDETNGNKLQDVIYRLINQGRELFQINETIEYSKIKVVRNYDKAGYGIMTSNEKEAIDLLAKTEGILLVYTARAFGGMTDFLKKGIIPKRSNVLFWHTGGLPALFNFAEKLI